MKTKTTTSRRTLGHELRACATLLLLSGSVLAGPRISQNYAIATDATDGGGRRATSASYTNDGSVGLVVGISTVASPVQTTKAGYIAQLYEVGGFLVAAAPLTLAEGGTRQLEANYLLDDATLLGVDRTQVSWSVLSGPIASISNSGLVTAGIVYYDTPAAVHGSFDGSTGSANLTVLDSTGDNFYSYASDGLDDYWQVHYFGQPPNPDAGPLFDPDGDGQDNRFEFIAGLDPTDPNSVFKLRIEKAAPPSNAKLLIFSPRFSDRTYTVRYRTDLVAPPLWQTLTGAAASDVGAERTVTDPNATGLKFYRVEITKP